MNFKSFSLLGLFGCWLYSGSVMAAVHLDEIVAVVNNDVIMQSELVARIAFTKQQLMRRNQGIPEANILTDQVLNHLLEERLQLALADRIGIVVDDEILNMTLQKLAKDNKMSLSQYKAKLEAEGYQYEKFRENIRKEIAMTRIRQRYVDNRIIVTPREIDDYLSTEKIQSGATEFRLRHILISLPADVISSEREAAQRKAENILQRLQAGEDFAVLAAEFSDGQQAGQGGDLGWRRREEIPSLFISYVDLLSPGDLSEWIENSSGLHLIQLAEIKEDQSRVLVEQYHVRHILIKASAVMNAQQIKSRLQRLKQRIDNGDNFIVLAKAHSEDQGSAHLGGDLGWVELGNLVPAFANQVRNLKVGEISEPFTTQFGGHVVELLDKREYDSTESMKRAKARRAIHLRKMDEMHRTWLQQLKDNAYIEYRFDS